MGPHCQRSPVKAIKQILHKLPRIKGILTKHQAVQAHVLAPCHPDCNRQHNSCVVHIKGVDMRSSSLYSLLRRLLSWCNFRHRAEGQAPKCDSQQIAQAQAGDSDTVVSFPEGV